METNVIALVPQPIKPGMTVFSSERERVGIVDHLRSADVKLSSNDPVSYGHAHFIPLEWVEHVDAVHVYLAKTSADVFRNWIGPPRPPTGMIPTAQIKSHHMVYAADGVHVGMVDRFYGVYDIMLMNNDAQSTGRYHTIPISWVDRVGVHVHLDKTSHEVYANWRTLANSAMAHTLPL